MIVLRGLIYESRSFGQDYSLSLNSLKRVTLLVSLCAIRAHHHELGMCPAGQAVRRVSKRVLLMVFLCM